MSDGLDKAVLAALPATPRDLLRRLAASEIHPEIVRATLDRLEREGRVSRRPDETYQAVTGKAPAPGAKPRQDVEVPQKPAIVRTTAGLRDALFDELEALRRGESTPQRAKAICNTAQQILKSAEVEMAFLREADKFTAIGALALGREEPE